MDGYSLAFASSELRADFLVVHAAVTQNGLALKYALEELQSNKFIVEAARVSVGGGLEALAVACSVCTVTIPVVIGVGAGTTTTAEATARVSDGAGGGALTVKAAAAARLDSEDRAALTTANALGKTGGAAATTAISSRIAAWESGSVRTL